MSMYNLARMYILKHTILLNVNISGQVHLEPLTCSYFIHRIEYNFH